MSFLFQHKVVSSVLLVLLYCGFILPINEAVFFDLTASKGLHLVFSYLMKLLFAVLLYMFTYITLIFIERVKNKNTFYKDWLKGIIVCLLPLSMVFLLIYPGHWVWDEFAILNASRVYELYEWQHVFTQFYYILSLYLIPSAVGIVATQLFLISAIIGYIFASLRNLLKHKKIAYLIILPVLLLPPILLYNFYPLRLPLYSYIELLFLFKVFVLLIKPTSIKNVNLELIVFIVLIAILAFWRNEGVFYLLFIPLLLYKFDILADIRKRKLTPLLAYCLLSSLIILGAFTITKYSTQPKYQLTATVNPLSNMLQKDLRGSRTNEHLAKINKVLDVEFIKKYPSYHEVPSLLQTQWAPLRSDFEKHLSEYYSGFAGLVIDNPDHFLKARLKTFLASNSMDPSALSAFPGAFDAGGRYVKASRNFFELNLLSKPINKELRHTIIKLLLVKPTTGSTTPLRVLMWNVSPVLILLFCAAVYFTIMRSWPHLLILGALFIHTTLVFLTAPAYYFMYYFPIYLCGTMLLVIFALMKLDNSAFIRLLRRKYAKSK